MKILVALAVGPLLLAAPAMAQNTTSSTSSLPPPTSLPPETTPQQPMQPLNGSIMSPRNGTPRSSTTLPSSWRGSSTGWSKHMTACRGEYSTYDPATDRYRDARGRTQTCAR